MPLARPLIQLDRTPPAKSCDDYVRLLKRDGISGHLYSRINSYLAQYSPYCLDDNFLNNLREQYWPMLWQLLTFRVLVECGLKPVKSGSDAPDLCFDLGANKLWVEAVCVGPGQGKNAVPQPPKEGSFEIPKEKILLRSSSGLLEKSNKVQNWRDKGFLQEGDKLVLALHQNACPSYRASDYEICSIELLTFGTIPMRRSRFSKPVFLKREHLSLNNENGSPVDLGIFGLEKYADVSALIYSEFGIHELFSFSRDAFRILHNPNAKAKLDLHLIELGRVQHQVSPDDIEEICFNPRGPDSYMGFL